MADIKQDSPNETTDDDPTNQTKPGAEQPAKPDVEGECRICLETETLANLVTPCGCSGTVKYAHLTCLKTWVHERMSLKCEICGSPYKDSLLPILRPEVEAALRHREELRQRVSEGVEEISPEEERWRRRNVFCRVLCVLFTFGLMICLLLVLGMQASESVWAAVILRIVAFALPLFLIFKATATCVEMRQYAVRAREAEEANRRPPV